MYSGGQRLSDYSDMYKLDNIAEWYMMEGVPFSCGASSIRGCERMGFDLVLNDRDTGEQRDRQMIWSGACGQRTYLKEASHPDGKFGVLQVY